MEIADLIDAVDDSDADPDYLGSTSESDIEDRDEPVLQGFKDSQDNEDELLFGAEAEDQMRFNGPEIRVYMEPAVERPDADSDKDSGTVKYHIPVQYCKKYSISVGTVLYKVQYISSVL